MAASSESNGLVDPVAAFDSGNSNGPLLFSPIIINGVRLENKVWLPAMVTWLSQDGTVTDDIRRRYLRFAEYLW